ncbi:hypothetical protein Unana1_08370 [Umbelopsis nana]
MDPSDATLIACSAISHISCDAVRRFSKEATTVWRQQLWKFAALAQVCSATHPQLAHRAARCSPDDHQEAIKLWSEYLFGDQSWNHCVVLLAMIRCLCNEGAITYGTFNSKTIAPETLMGCKTSKGDATTIIWYGQKMVELNRNIPTPLAAPPRFAGEGRLLPITESAIMAERQILSYIRSSAPHLLGSHAAHALLDLPTYGNSVWQDGNGDPVSEDEFQQPESTQNGQIILSSSEQYTEDNSDI